ncbi:LuxR C-terminal-related transcriptional regulator [Nocardioides sp. SYSU DS0651]|uniref:LuxR C-terminal-related transcriptional regulator n=1 Tax=Nocardioides sp. SYSU DS0651 TaxID=3415955 RepID=UPI003F4B3C60
MTDISCRTASDHPLRHQGRAPIRDPATPAPWADDIPRLPTSYVARPHLTRRLARLATLTVVESLPGFGARTLLAGWTREERAAGRRVAWLRVADAPGEDELLDRVRDALGRAGAVTSDRRGAGHRDDQRWLHQLASADQPVIVVVDDADRLPPASAAALMSLARVHTVHLVVRCRPVHPFKAAAGHDVESNVVHPADLALRPDELPAFAAAWGHRLDEATAARLYDAVGGWVLPLRLVLDATPCWGDDLATHAADDFLRREVLPQVLEDGLLDAAMRLSVPADLDPLLARRLLAAPDDEAPDAVLRLEQRGLLWPTARTDGQPRWVLPTLLRRTLRRELEIRDPRTAIAAHRTVALVLSDRATPAELGRLARHARAAQDWGLLTDLWREHGWTLLASDRDAFQVAYGGYAAADLAALTVPAALAATLSRTAPGADWMTLVETMLRHYAHVGARFLSSGDPDLPTADLVDLLVAAVVAQRNDGQLDEAVLTAGRLEALTSRRPVDAPVPADQAAWTHFQCATTYLLAGRPGDAHRMAVAAYEAAPRSPVGTGTAGLLAALSASGGHRPEAERWLEVHGRADLSAYWAAPLAKLPARAARAMIAMDELDEATASEELAGTSLSSDYNGMWPVLLLAWVRHAVLFGEPVTMLARIDHLADVHSRRIGAADGLGRQLHDRCQADLLLSLGEVDRARGLLDRGVQLIPWLFAPAARFHLITGDPARAVRVARSGVWNDAVPARDRFELHMICALALHAQRNLPAATEEFRRAHALGTHTGGLEPYLLLGPERLDELLTASGLDLPADVRRRLAGQRRPYPESVSLVRLTPRELVVLREMDRHATAAGIARAQSVSVNTVKKQMVSVYAKLGVHDRAAALLRARRLGLLQSRPPGSG